MVAILVRIELVAASASLTATLALFDAWIRRPDCTAAGGVRALAVAAATAVLAWLVCS